MSTNNRIETIVGAGIVGLAVLFFFYASKTAGVSKGFTGGYTVIAEFDNAEGINIGTDVRLAGIKIGSVTGQSLNSENYMARLELTLDPNVTLAEDTAAKVTSEGLLGSKFIALEPGGSETKLTDGSMMTLTQGAVDIWSLISSTMFDRAKSAPAQSTPPAPEPPAQ